MRVRRLFTLPAIPSWLVLVWKAADFLDTSDSLISWGKPIVAFLANDSGTLALLAVALLGLTLSVIGPDIVGVLKRKSPRFVSEGTLQLAHRTLNTNNAVSQVHVGPEGGQLIDLKIISQELLNPEAAQMLEEFDVVNPEAQVVKIQVLFSAEEQTTVSFARLSIGTITEYPLQFNGARFQGSMQPLGIYFQLPHWIRPGIHNARIGILVGAVPHWDEWDFQLSV
ncbi:MAG: hypothetical protein CMJ45_03385 [Planctomyces sp.]|nr:hypothetical protein [Planctomyces sp.]